MAFVGVLNIRKVEAGERFAVVAEDRPVDPLVRQPAEDAGAGEGLGVVVEVSLRRPGQGEGSIGHGHRGRGGEPGVADGETLGQSGQDRQQLRRVHAHDLGRLSPRQRVLVVFGQVRGDGGLEVQHEALVVGNGAGRGIVVGVQLIGRVLEALARIGAGHQIGVRIRRLDLEHLDLATQIVRVPFRTGQPVEGVSSGRDVARIGVEKAEHVVERPVLQHQVDNVVDLTELVRHGVLPRTFNGEQATGELRRFGEPRSTLHCNACWALVRTSPDRPSRRDAGTPDRPARRPCRCRNRRSGRSGPNCRSPVPWPDGRTC